MKTTLTAVIALLFAVTVQAQTGAFATNCPTIEQQQAEYNKNKALAITVRDTYTQQLQCHYWQLGTYYQQLDKDNQQKAKDIQQIAKDKQQIEKEAQLIAWEMDLKARESMLVNCHTELENLRLLIVQLKLIINEEECECEGSRKIREHLNRSGGGDSTNPGGGGNEDGYNNPNNS